ncbi:hypothetical protein BBP40_011705 [Aspergillus hancockii]|nr:hypothetical protein BBP40_011705 [Aspergillus hancockii]
MGAITAKDVAIAQLVVYIPTALATVFVVLRHSFHTQLGWIYLGIFSGIRIAGAIMEIIGDRNPNNSSDIEWAMILHFDESSQGVPSSPGSQRSVILQGLSSSSGIANKLQGLYSENATAISRRSKAIELLHIPALIALVLSIIGGTDQASSEISQHAGGKTKPRVATILFLAVYVALCVLWLTIVKDLRLMVSSQKRIVGAILFAVPLIACRLLYSLISIFGHDRRFSTFGGDATVQLCMATIEEFIVVLVYTVLGVLTPRSGGKSKCIPAGSQQGASVNTGYSHLLHREVAAQDGYQQN